MIEELDAICQNCVLKGDVLALFARLIREKRDGDGTADTIWWGFHWSVRRFCDVLLKELGDVPPDQT